MLSKYSPCGSRSAPAVSTPKRRGSGTMLAGVCVVNSGFKNFASACHISCKAVVNLDNVWS